MHYPLLIVILLALFSCAAAGIRVVLLLLPGNALTRRTRN